MASFNHSNPILFCIFGIGAALDELRDLWGASRQAIPLRVKTEVQEEAVFALTVSPLLWRMLGEEVISGALEAFRQEITNLRVETTILWMEKWDNKKKSMSLF